MQELQVFENGLFGEIRTTLDEQGRVWFVASDITNVLEIKNTSSALKNIKEKHLTYTVAISGGQKRELRLISEAGLYKLIFNSRKEEAEQFQDWVYEDVLPTIRKTGKYDMSESAYIKQLKNNNKVLEKENKHLERKTKAILDMSQKMHIENRKNSVGNISKEIVHLCKQTEDMVYSARAQMDLPKEYARPVLDKIERDLQNIQMNIREKNLQLSKAINRERDRKIMQDVKNNDLESYYQNYYLAENDFDY